MASNQDCEAVVDVIRSVFEEYSFTWEAEGYHADLYDLEGHYDGKSAKFFVAENDGKVVGTVGIEFFPPHPDDPCGLTESEGLRWVSGSDCSLERLYVHPSGRRLGVGRALMQHVVDVAKAAGRTQMEIWSDKRFVDAHRLYGQFGAVVVGDRILDDPDLSPEWGLALEL